MRFVEVIDVEDQLPVGRSEDPEVGQVRVSAELHDQVRARAGGQILGHDPRRAAIEGERRGAHAAVANGDELRDAGPVLVLEDLDRFRPIGGGLPDG
jgi:hypothetical protein